MTVVEVRRWDHTAVRPSDHAARDLCNPLWCEAELSEECWRRRRCTEAIHGDDCAVAPGPAIPSEADPGFNADARAHRGGEDRLTICGVLITEEFKAWRRDNTCWGARRFKEIRCGNGEVDL